MKKAVLPIASGVVSKSLSKCSHFAFFNLENKMLSIVENSGIDFHNSVALRDWIKNNGIADLITHRIDKELIDLLSSEKINLFVGVPLVSADQIIQSYRNGKLESDKNIIAEIMTKNVQI